MIILFDCLHFKPNTIIPHKTTLKILKNKIPNVEVKTLFLETKDPKITCNCGKTIYKHYLKAFLIKIRKNVQKEMYNKSLTRTFRYSFLQLYYVFEECFIKSNAITLNYSLCIAFIRIKIKS